MLVVLVITGRADQHDFVAEYFPALMRAIDGAEREIWLETYIFADDAAGRLIAASLSRAARRGVRVRVLVDGWGAKLYLTPALQRDMTQAGIDLVYVSTWESMGRRVG
jgi:phosphatidylserine/phosphatidylglycerophosphate/cardiolipin synthase-like enzyme